MTIEFLDWGVAVDLGSYAEYAVPLRATEEQRWNLYWHCFSANRRRLIAQITRERNAQKMEIRSRAKA